MKTLLLLRHAKSSWAEPGLNDHDRPLNDRGRADAPTVGELLLAEELKPDLILSSTAKRAHKTARKVANAADYTGDIHKHDELYLAHSGQIISVISNLVEDPQKLLIVGHNPGIEECASQLSRSPIGMPTACLVVLTCAISSWTQMSRTTDFDLQMVWTPKDKQREL